MSPTKRLKPVQQIAHSREQRAAHSMGEAQRQLKEEEQKLAQLRAYHDEYLQRFSEASKKGISVPQLQEYRAFLDKLDEAIRQQEAVVAASKVEHKGSQKDWQQRRTRTQALGKVIDRYRDQEMKDADRNEQKESDDRGGRFPKG